MNFSLEIGLKTNLSNLPKVKDVYITLLPGEDFRQVAEKAKELANLSFNPVPHFPARSIKNLDILKDYVMRCKDGGVKQAISYRRECPTSRRFSLFFTTIRDRII